MCSIGFGQLDQYPVIRKLVIQALQQKNLKEDLDFQQKILALIRDADVGINNIVAETISINDPTVFPDDMPEEIRDIIRKQMKGEVSLIKIKSMHRKN